MFFGGDWKNASERDVLGVPEPVPATWFREGAVGIRRLTRSRDGARKGAVVASGRRVLLVMAPDVVSAPAGSRRGELLQAPVRAAKGALHGEQLVGGLLVLGGFGGLGERAHTAGELLEGRGQGGQVGYRSAHGTIFARLAPTTCAHAGGERAAGLARPGRASVPH